MLRITFKNPSGEIYWAECKSISYKSSKRYGEYQMKEVRRSSTNVTPAPHTSVHRSWTIIKVEGIS